MDVDPDVFNGGVVQVQGIGDVRFVVAAWLESGTACLRLFGEQFQVACFGKAGLDPGGASEPAEYEEEKEYGPTRTHVRYSSRRRR